MEKSFARKLSFQPLLNSIIFGAAVGSFVFIIFKQDFPAGLLAGLIVFFIQTMAIYPRYLPTLYGRWTINERSISYYDYSTWQKRVEAIYFPWAKKQQVVEFEDIMSYSLVVNKESDKWTPHYIILNIDNGHDVALDVSYNLLKSGKPEKDVEWVVDFITSKLNQKTVQVMQAK